MQVGISVLFAIGVAQALLPQTVSRPDIRSVGKVSGWRSHKRSSTSLTSCAAHTDTCWNHVH